MSGQDDDRDLTQSERNRLTRRQLLGGASALGVAMAAAGVLAGCGSGSTTAPDSSAAGTPKRGGTLRIGIGGGGEGDSLDGHMPLNFATQMRDLALYDQLTLVDNNFKFANRLVESVESNATADEWTIRLKQGIEFHNGKTVSADDAMFTIQRMIDPKVGAIAGPMFGSVDPKGMTKVDDRTLRVKMLRPFATFGLTLGDGGAMAVVPVGYDPEKPVGTGPFKYKSFTPGQQSVFERFPNYWGDQAYFDELVLIDITDDAARVNALLSGQVDAVNMVPYAQIPIIEQNSGLKTLESKTAAFNPITMRVDMAPFDDVRVRQAIRLCLDRSQVIEGAFSGHAVHASDLYAPYDPAFDSSLVRDQDLEQAKSLLKQAGKEGLKVELVTSPVATGMVETCSVLAASAAKAGMTIKVRQVDPSTFYGENFLQWPFAVDWYPGLHYLTQASMVDGPGANLNETHFTDPDYNKLFDQAESELDEAKRGEIIHQMQKILFDRGGYIVPVYPNIVDAFKANLGGMEQDLTGAGFGRGSYEKLYFT